MALLANVELDVIYGLSNFFVISNILNFCRIRGFTIGWKMLEIGQLVVVDFGGPLSLYGLVRMRKK